MQSQRKVWKSMRSFIIGLLALAMCPCAIAAAPTGSDSGTFYYSFPEEMSRSFDLPNGTRSEVYGARGFALTENENSFLYQTSVTLRVHRVVNPASIGKKEELIYEYAVLEIMDTDGDTVFVRGENEPPAKPTTVIFQGTGKYVGITGGGDMGWNCQDSWPSGGRTRDYTFNWEIVDEPDYNLAEPGPDYKETITTWIYRYVNEVDEDYSFPDGRRRDHHDEEGFFISPEDPTGPYHNIHMWSHTSALFREGEGWGNGLVFLWGWCQMTDMDGDQFFMFGQWTPPAEPRMWVTGGTGKWKNFKSVFTSFGSTDPWPPSWPGDIEVNGMPFYYDPESIGDR